MFAEYFYYHMLFENLLLKSYGNSFQEYFYNVMYAHNKNFRKIEVQGAVGDRKCDGYIYNIGVFYQVYGPKDTTVSNSQMQKYAIDKAEGDYLGLKKHVDTGYWEEIKEYIFVINNQRGLFPDFDQEIRRLNNTHKPVIFSIFDRSDLIKIFDGLTISDKMSICNAPSIPDLNIGLINNAIIRDIINHLVTNNKVGSNSNKLINPDFHKKLNWNKLNEHNSNALIMGNYSVNLLDNYLASYTSPISEQLCSIYNDLYSKSILEFPNNPNEQFIYILNNSFDSTNLSPIEISIYTINTYIIMSKYFESCDIFEEPKSDES